MRREPAGRPLRFFLLLSLGWIALRAFNYEGRTPASPAEEPASVPQSPMTPFAQSANLGKAASLGQNFTAAAPLLLPPLHDAPRLVIAPPAAPRPQPEAGGLDLMQFIQFAIGFANRRYARDEYDLATFAPTAAPSPMPVPPFLTQSSPSERWRASSWVLWRDGGGSPNAVSVGRLGGSQAGVRVDYALSDSKTSRLAAYARMTSALQRPAAPEAAAGVSYQPSRQIPISFAAERRIALGHGARNANAVMAVGGFGPEPIGGGLMAEAYAQAGVVGFRRADLFVDGKMSVLKPAGDSIRWGGAMSGGAQPGVNRLDVGPELQWRLPLAGSNARLSLEWRHRIAGQAEPGSGLTLTLGADF